MKPIGVLDNRNEFVNQSQIKTMDWSFSIRQAFL
jgi:hypothetical protein